MGVNLTTQEAKRLLSMVYVQLDLAQDVLHRVSGDMERLSRDDDEVYQMKEDLLKARRLISDIRHTSGVMVGELGN